MAQALTHQMLAREAAKMLVEQNNIANNINTDREKDVGREVSGYKSGDTVKIKIPPVPTVFNGPVFAEGNAAPAWDETFVSLTVNTQKHVPITFGSAERVMDLTDFKQRFLNPAMQSLGSMINADLQKRAYPLVPNVVGTWGQVPNTRRTYREVDALL
jgi:hypothetical protein